MLGRMQWISKILCGLLILNHSKAGIITRNKTAVTEIEDRLKVDVQKTVDKVSSILADHPDLPRLTEDEIIDLMNDIASENVDYGNEKRITTYEKDSPGSESNRESKQKLMVVLPYQPRDESAVEEVFTKVPLVAVATEPASNTQIHKEDIDTAASFITDNVYRTGATNYDDERQATIMKEVLDHFSKHANRLNEKFSSQYNEEALDFDLNLPTEDKNLAESSLNPALGGSEEAENMEEILMSYGLMPNHKVDAKAETQIDAYTKFKPLPSSQDTVDNLDMPADIQEILNSFDALAHLERSQKSLNVSDNEELLENQASDMVEALADSNSKTASVPDNKNEVINKTENNDTSSDTSNDTDSNSETASVPENKNELINKTENNDTSTDTSDTSNATEPLANKLLANDSDTAAQTQSESFPSSSDSTPDTNLNVEGLDTTEEPRNPSLTDLESSFGGQPPIDPSEEMLPPPKKNGFYYYVDWNTFLEVGEGDSKVNIRFEPKLGDPLRFLPVTVP